MFTAVPSPAFAFKASPPGRQVSQVVPKCPPASSSITRRAGERGSVLGVDPKPFGVCQVQSFMEHGTAAKTPHPGETRSERLYCHFSRRALAMSDATPQKLTIVVLATNSQGTVFSCAPRTKPGFAADVGSTGSRMPQFSLELVVPMEDACLGLSSPRCSQRLCATCGKTLVVKLISVDLDGSEESSRRLPSLG